MGEQAAVETLHCRPNGQMAAMPQVGLAMGILYSMPLARSPSISWILTSVWICERQCGQWAPPEARFWAIRVAHSSQTLPCAQGSKTMQPSESKHTTHCGSAEELSVPSLSALSNCRPTTVTAGLFDSLASAPVGEGVAASGSSAPSSSVSCLSSCQKFSPPFLNSKRLRGPVGSTSVCCATLGTSTGRRLAERQQKQMKMRP
mmetsp:Transcript_43747/g.121576  ORF Transcript_43747/g.121576 Transcript_43747/m.121576 type:complete len:203 (-) Transcript_43747:236-844(-)